MMFLQYVAKDLLAKHGTNGLADIAVVFPNKRASLFLNRALYEEAGRPVWSPAYYTISDLFRRHSELVVPDQIALVFKLYNIFADVTGSDEPLDHFYSWGQLMLSDFDDLDKNLVDADKLFINLESWQEMKDFSFLSEQQRKSLEEFFGKVMDDTALQHRFNDIWKYLGNIYHAFRHSLKAEGLAYEGMLYRDVAEHGISDFHYKHYVFVGFNLLQKVEQQLFAKLKDKGIAEFYWDYDNYYMDAGHEAGRYIRRYVEKFPNELSAERVSSGINIDDIYDNLSKPKDITYISAPTEDIQARFVSQWLEKSKVQSSELNVQCSVSNIPNTAIVLCDEHLLQNVIHCLPEDVKNVNITTGYPLSASPAASLVYALLNLQLNGITKDKEHYRLLYVNQLLRHPFAKFISDDCKNLYQELNEHKTYYPSRQQLTEGRDEAISLLFKNISPAEEKNVDLLSWMSDIMKLVGIGSRNNDDPLMHESVFRMYTLLQRLDNLMIVTTNGLKGEQNGKQMVSTVILQRLITQLIDSTTIPFHGEPATGIQIMGVLETRNLDFDHVLVLSCNEGNLPKGIDDASFIPHSIRRGYEMTTVENKVAIYSYYFYSLLQRAKDATLTFNNATDDGRQGEMSRFMLQYMVESNGQNIRSMTLQSGQQVSPIMRHEVEKKGKVAESLHSMKSLSPTALSRYLRCNLQFYYNVICGLKEQDDNEEDEIDNATFGNIFHRTAQLIYQHLGKANSRHTITPESIDALIKDKRKIEEFIDTAFREKLFKVDDPAFHPHYNGLQLLNRNVIRLYIMRLLKLDKRSAPFDILALEETFYDKMTFNVKDYKRTILLGGQIDRLDRIPAGLNSPLPSKGACIRVVDYKTGTPLTSTPPSTEEIYKPEYVDTKHTVYYLQAFLYSAIIRRKELAQKADNQQDTPVAPALLFIRQASADDYNPILTLKDKTTDGKKKATYSTVFDIKDVAEEYGDCLRQLLEEIFNEDIPFRPTAFPERCENCPYKNICGI